MKLQSKIILFAGLGCFVLVFIILGDSLIRKFTSKPSLSSIDLPSVRLTDAADNVQFNKIADFDSSYEINHGLTVERIGTIKLNGIPTPLPKYVSLLILNHTDEPIAFADIGFGVEVFEYQSAAREWSKIKLPYTPEKTQKTLPPKTEKFDFSVLNSWEFTEEDLIDVDANTIRILIRGKGEISDKNYGAFLDIHLQE